MRLDTEAQDSQSLLEVVLPQRGVPLARPAFEHLSPPNVVDQYVDVPVRPMNVVSQPFHLTGVEVIDDPGNASPAETCDQFRCLLDRFRAVVVRAPRAWRACAAPGTDDGGAGLA